MTRYKKNSVYNKNNERLDNERGIHDHKGKWDNDKIDLYLDEFLAGKTYMSARDDFLMKLGRTISGLSSHFWKVVTRYKDPRGGRKRVVYVPKHRHNRSNEEFTTRDDYVIKMACSEDGIERGCYKASWIAVLLARTEQEVQKYMIKRAGRFIKKNTGFGVLKRDTPEIELAKALHEIL
jgi:hypothetical protein